MLTRRNLLALSAAVPFSHLPRRLDLPDLRVENLRLDDGVRIRSISPDGTTLVGTADDNQVCFLATDSLTELSRGEFPGNISNVDWMSLRWSPDGSKIVFAVKDMSDVPETAIYSVDVERADISELIATDNERAATDDSDSQELLQDQNPEWLDDQTIVFARNVWDESGNSAVFLSMGLADVESAVWNDLQGLNITMISGPTRMLNDGRLVFVANPLDSSYLADPKDNAYRLFTLAAGEEPVQIETGDLQTFIIVDADETHVLLHDIRRFATSRLALDDSTTQEDVSVLFEDDQDRSINSLPAIGPEPGTLVATMNDANLTVAVYKDDRVREIAYLRGPETPGLECIWVEGHVLVTGKDASWIIEPDL